jgi:hypothetical protein
MIVQRYYAGFSFERIGGLAIGVTGDKDSLAYSASVSTGSYYHGQIVDNFYHTASLQAAIASALNAAAVAAGSTATYTLTWSNETLRYTLNVQPPFQATLGTVARRVLGMPSSISRPTVNDPQPASTRTPDFVIAPAVKGTSGNTGDVHLRGQIRSAMTDRGLSKGLGPSTRAVVHRWMQKHEPASATFRWASGGAWTWEDLFLHCGTWEPILLCKTTTATISTMTFADFQGRYTLHGPDATFEPAPTFADYDDRWDVPFSTVVSQRTNAP